MMIEGISHTTLTNAAQTMRHGHFIRGINLNMKTTHPQVRMEAIEKEVHQSSLMAVKDQAPSDLRKEALTINVKDVTRRPVSPLKTIIQNLKKIRIMAQTLTRNDWHPPSLQDGKTTSKKGEIHS